MMNDYPFELTNRKIISGKPLTVNVSTNTEVLGEMEFISNK